MAKGIDINGTLRGKRGGVVYSRVNGEQISRVKVDVKNPKTSAQMAQRAIFATATAAYSFMKPIVDHSREGIAYGAKTQQAFMRDALSLLRARAAEDNGNFLIPGVKALMANPFIVSRGSLASAKSIAYDNENEVVKISNMVNLDVAGDKYITAKSWCDALGINKGDQITLVAIVSDANQPILGEYAGREYRQNKFVYCRITVKTDAADNDLVYDNNSRKFGSAVIVEGIGRLANGANFEIETIAANSAEIEIAGDILAFACIRSVKSGNSWLRSNEELVLAGNQLVYNFADILPAWLGGAKTELEFESERYLNNAEPEAIATAVYSVYAGPALSADSQDVIEDVAILKKQLGGQTTAAFIVSDSGTGYTLKQNGHLVAIQDTFEGSTVLKSTAERLLGYTLVIDQEWRGKTSTNAEEYELQQESGVDEYVKKISGYQGPGTFEMPGLLAAIGTDNKAHFVVNDGQAVADNRTPAKYGIAYGTGSMNYSPLDAWRLSQLKNYCVVSGIDSGTEFAIGSEITLETYNRITQDFEDVEYSW